MNVKDILLKRIRQRSFEEAAFLAGEFARAASEEKEAILASLEYEKWLAEACLDALPDQAKELFEAWTLGLLILYILILSTISNS